MPRLSATPGVLGAAIAAAIALWWLPGVYLQARSGFADLPMLSARAASCLVLAQAVLVCLFAARWFGARDPSVDCAGAPPTGDSASTVESPVRRAPARERVATCAATALSAVAPAWPLLALLWLTSELSMLVLAGSQLLIALAAVLLALLGGALARSPLGSPTSECLQAAAGLLPAAVAWNLRGELQAWVFPA